MELNVNDEAGDIDEGKDPDGEATPTGEGQAPEGGGQESSADEECEPKRIVPDPGMPTQAEVDEHNVDHLPYRSWCECCVRGKATGEPHKRIQVESTIPIIAFDYMFVMNGRVAMRQDTTEEERKNAILKILVVKDSKSRSIFGHVVKRKGVEEDGYSVKRLKEDLEWLGYTKVILKSDGERAIVRLLRETLRAMKTSVVEMEQIAHEHPPPYDSRANGSVENACRQLKGQLRTLTLGLEQRIQKRIPPEHPIMSWLVEHCAWLLTARLRGEDGKTAHQRVRGRPFAKKLVEFGERVLYKLPIKGPRADERATLEPRWKHGLMVGYARHTNEYCLWDGSSVSKSRALMRMPSDRRWDTEGLQQVAIDVQRFYGCGMGVATAFDEGEAIPQPAVGEDKTRAPKNIVIRQADWLKYEGTVGCPKCAHARDHGWGLMGGPHSPECVQRFKQLFEETAEGQARIARAKAKQDAWQERQRPVAEERNEPPVQFEDMAPEGANDNEATRGQPSGWAAGATEGQSSDWAQVDAGMGDDNVEYEMIDDNMDEDQGAATPMATDEQVSSLEPLMHIMTEDVQAVVTVHNTEILRLVGELGGSTRQYAKERKKQMKAMVAEIYSPPRVTNAAKLLPGMNIIPGFALDLTTVDEHGQPWDFAKTDMRQACREMIRREKPTLVVGSPLCTAFCTWQYLNNAKGDPEKIARAWAAAMVHLNFSCEVYSMQIDDGRYFLHEHPDKATSWRQKCVVQVLQREEVDTIVSDQCQYDQKDNNGQPIKKPTRWMSNAHEVLKSLGKRCKGRGGLCSMGGQHRICSGGRARAAAIYPFVLCKAILQGLKNQMRHDQRLHPGVHGLQNPTDDIEVMLLNALIDEEAQGRTKDRERKFYDGLTGQPLDPDLVREARKQELEYFSSKGVWHVRPRAEAFAKMGKAPITVKWIDVNKGDDENPKYRSRLVAREIRKIGEDAIFAPTPPLESLRTVISLAATDLERDVYRHTRDGQSVERTQIMVIDISRAYFNAKKDEDGNPTYVELPEEDPAKASGMCGKLRVHMYGTRAAADGWHCEYSQTLEAMGFQKGDASACVFRHAPRRIVATVHGDDFTIAGPKHQLDWMKEQMQSKYELTETGRIGPGEDDDKEVKVLNRIIRWTPSGIEYEGDPRQVERLIIDLGLENTKHTGTPGMKQTWDQVQQDKELPQSKHTAYRAVAARGNFLSVDRPEAQYAAKEICRWMASPTTNGVQALKRLGKYLDSHRRVVFEYPFQKANKLEVYSDTDWAGCLKTRKSTSGGCIMLGQHLIKSWSSTQGIISLSSGEAEFYGVVKAAGMAFGYQALLDDLGVSLPLRAWTDSSATMGICSRSGLGKLRHVDTRSLWVQQRVRGGDLEIRKVRGEVNPADLFTKHLSSEERVTNLMKLFGCRYADGRSKEAPQLRRDTGVQHTGVLACEIDNTSDMVIQDGYAYKVSIVEDFGGQRVPEAYLHDVTVLPHQIKGDIAAVFPRALAADELEETPETIEPLEARGIEIGKQGRRCLVSTPSLHNCQTGLSSDRAPGTVKQTGLSSVRPLTR